MLTGGVVAAVVAAMTVPVPGHAATTSCHPDRRVNITRPVEKAYRDPVGDAYPGHGDITSIRISDLQGVVTFKIDIKNMARRDRLVIYFDTNCNGYGFDNYILLFERGYPAELSRLNKNSDLFPMRPPRIQRHGSTYTFQFSSNRFGGTTAFRFNMAINFTQDNLSDLSDVAPDHSDYAHYDLLSR
jgi:hypothetical protein